jgi:transcriptional regulator with XRE-family HTH domain
MPLLADRVRGLLAVKNRQQTDLANAMGIEPNLLSKWVGGFKKMDLDDLKRLAEALDATSDYLIGLGDDYRVAGVDDYRFAAAKMSFGYFERDWKFTPEQKQRCRNVWLDDDLLQLEGAPVTGDAWKSLARMIDRAVPSPPHIGLITA